MAINYSVAGLKNPALQGAGEVKYYAKAQASGEVGIEQLAEEIAYATALTDGDVVSAIRALVNRIRLHIQEGKIVRLESLGSFQVQLRGGRCGVAGPVHSGYDREGQTAVPAGHVHQGSA